MEPHLWLKRNTREFCLAGRRNARHAAGVMMDHMWKATLGLALLLAATGAEARVRSGMVVSTAWLGAHLNQPDVIVLQVSRDAASYSAGHIPGARMAAWGDFTATVNGVHNELPPVADLERWLGRLGVDGKARIILYDDRTGVDAARAWFTLDWLGLGERAALLDGGLGRWKAEKRALSTQTPVVTPSAFKANRVNKAVLAEFPAVSRYSSNAGAGKRAVTIVDARPAADYAAGHIPGAVSVPWQGTEVSPQDSALRSEADIRALYTKAGVDPAKPAVTYCNSGVQASHAYFTLKYLGYAVSLYDGSMGEWRDAKSAPVEK